MAIDLRAVTDPAVDARLPGGRVLLGFVDAALGDGDTAAAAGAVANTLGRAAVVNAASVIATFQMMNRVADATGMPVGQGSRIRNAETITLLGLERFDHNG